MRTAFARFGAAGLVSARSMGSSLSRSTRHVATWKLAACVLFLDWKGGGEPVTLSNVVLNEWGLPQGRTKRKALAELEALGLVSVERRAKRSPLLKRKI
jgi:hypothetical protein